MFLKLSLNPFVYHVDVVMVVVAVVIDVVGLSGVIFVSTFAFEC